eukprot:Skav206863  [mRNA]  locus=scaffold1667:373773:386371:- [translate_table: standard]
MIAPSAASELAFYQGQQLLTQPGVRERQVECPRRRRAHDISTWLAKLSKLKLMGFNGAEIIKRWNDTTTGDTTTSTSGDTAGGATAACRGHNAARWLDPPGRQSLGSNPYRRRALLENAIDGIEDNVKACEDTEEWHKKLEKLIDDMEGATATFRTLLQVILPAAIPKAKAKAKPQVETSTDGEGTAEPEVQLEIMWGTAAWLLIYFTSGIYANFLSCVLHPEALGVGSSGCLCGLIGGWLYISAGEAGSVGAVSLLENYLTTRLSSAQFATSVVEVFCHNHMPFDLAAHFADTSLPALSLMTDACVTVK